MEVCTSPSFAGGKGKNGGPERGEGSSKGGRGGGSETQKLVCLTRFLQR